MNILSFAASCLIGALVGWYLDHPIAGLLSGAALWVIIKMISTDKSLVESIVDAGTGGDDV